MFVGERALFLSDASCERNAFFPYTYIHIQQIAEYNLLKWLWKREDASFRRFMTRKLAEAMAKRRVNHSWILPRVSVKLFLNLFVYRLPAERISRLTFKAGGGRSKAQRNEVEKGRRFALTSPMKFFETYRDRNYQSPAHNRELTAKVAKIAQRP